MPLSLVDADRPPPAETSATNTAEPADTFMLTAPPQATQQAIEFADFYQTHRHMVHSIVWKIVKNPDTADEVAQDVFTKAWAKWHTYTDRGLSRKQWVAQIAFNTAVNKYHQSRRRPEELYEQARAELVASTNAEHYEPTPEDAYMMSGFAGDLKSILEQLPAPQRKLVVCVYLIGMSQQEAAAITGVPIGTVMSRLHRARRHIQELLASEMDLEI